MSKMFIVDDQPRGRHLAGAELVLEVYQVTSVGDNKSTKKTDRICAYGDEGGIRINRRSPK